MKTRREAKHIVETIDKLNGALTEQRNVITDIILLLTEYHSLLLEYGGVEFTPKEDESGEKNNG